VQYVWGWGGVLGGEYIRVAECCLLKEPLSGGILAVVVVSFGNWKRSEMETYLGMGGRGAASCSGSTFG
jgi:hypothetical protein